MASREWLPATPTSVWMWDTTLQSAHVVANDINSDHADKSRIVVSVVDRTAGKKTVLFDTRTGVATSVGFYVNNKEPHNIGVFVADIVRAVDETRGKESGDDDRVKIRKTRDDEPDMGERARRLVGHAGRMAWLYTVGPPSSPVDESEIYASLTDEARDRGQYYVSMAMYTMGTVSMASGLHPLLVGSSYGMITSVPGSMYRLAAGYYGLYGARALYPTEQREFAKRSRALTLLQGTPIRSPGGGRRRSAGLGVTMFDTISSGVGAVVDAGKRVLFDAPKPDRADAEAPEPAGRFVAYRPSYLDSGRGLVLRGAVLPESAIGDIPPEIRKVLRVTGSDITSEPWPDFALSFYVLFFFAKKHKPEKPPQEFKGTAPRGGSTLRRRVLWDRHKGRLSDAYEFVNTNNTEGGSKDGVYSGLAKWPLVETLRGVLREVTDTSKHGRFPLLGNLGSSRNAQEYYDAWYADLSEYKGPDHTLEIRFKAKTVPLRGLPASAAAALADARDMAAKAAIERAGRKRRLP